MIHCQNCGVVPTPEEQLPVLLPDDVEWRILNDLMLFPSVVADAAESYDPSRLTAYLYDLAKAFNAFYHDHPVKDAEEPVRSSRLALLAGLKTVLANGLRLLAIVGSPVRYLFLKSSS